MRRFFQAFLAAFFCLALPAAAQADRIEPAPQTARAVFAGGCFWCMESEFDSQAGVISVTSGYMGGSAETATYKQVSTGRTGHLEVVEVVFDPAQVNYETLLNIFWSNVDPFDAEGQFCDKGSQYAAGIFYHGDGQKEAAEASLAAAEKKLGKKVATFIRAAMPFYAAEEYHQEYYKKNAFSYKTYRIGCGRDRRLDAVWGDTKEKEQE
ncbi:MAG TPA: peptide-methionine (S)-S-oxide reductase MsrA [Alphaproteobacteria bacterium]|nr:peptide-methionine (S)-S-oxide reductase MsrA [Alphaproteobacteria bacterium]